MSARFVPSTRARRRRRRPLVRDPGHGRARAAIAATTTSCRRAAEAAALGIAPVRSLYLGELDGVPCRSAELPDDHEPPPGMAFRTLRDLYGRIDEHLWTLAGRAAQLVEWDRTHVHCGRCGTPTEHAPGRARAPLSRVRPRRLPAPLAGRDRARHARRRDPAGARAALPGGMYSVLAGFVEPGESLEECVARELEEEVGIEVDEITYFASQPWPFPHSLMIGFTATLAQRRPAHRGGRAGRRALVHARRPARAARPPVDRPQADRRLAVAAAS